MKWLGCASVKHKAKQAMVMMVEMSDTAQTSMELKISESEILRND